MRVKITGTGLYLPETVETAAEIAPRIGKSEEWIVKRTGVARRHIADRPLEEMAAEAAREALGDGPQPDLIINASASTRQLLPDTSVFIQRALGFSGIPSFSVHATCLSFFVAFEVAASMICQGSHRRVLLVSVENASSVRNDAEPESAALLGDGAAAAVLEPTPEGEDSELLSWRMTTLPEHAELTQVPGFGMRLNPNDPGVPRVDNLFQMDGPAVLLTAREPVVQMCVETGAEAGIHDPADIDLVIPHQASGRALKAVTRFAGFPFPKEKIVDVVGEYGNTAAASIPMTLAHAVREGRLRRGHVAMLVGTGAGLSIGAAFLRY